ncbi:hypothetical protein A5630_04485 [Mycolicibacterium mucogenicum]|uniref:Uncharacterized protein n=1 Tax=Mycolicibacterium mucogenicum TaxID=56689 RepID=A0A1A3GQA8_MYCMU|nr:hypothetical protein [Mycolicibacterium mucogenicum]OBJ37528.1 hypothetical protein A5630_04485 [Mycolicibacterium mucogenicum]
MDSTPIRFGDKESKLGISDLNIDDVRQTLLPTSRDGFRGVVIDAEHNPPTQWVRVKGSRDERRHGRGESPWSSRTTAVALDIVCANRIGVFQPAGIASPHLHFDGAVSFVSEPDSQ